ncbi:MAG: S41 family peptidase [Candidatus Hydrogenedentes bacterium]|nr:S41 family peptidase [Candidatus Hydrogenedentota bacterium]
MPNRNAKFEFVALFTFLLALTLILSNGFVSRISAQAEQTDVYQEVEPIGDVVAKILSEHVYDPDMNRLVQGALFGLMSSLDRHSSFIPAEALQGMREDTKGEFEGIGVTIKINDAGEVMVFSPVTNSPAQEAGLHPFDIITKIDGIPVGDLWTPAMSDDEKLKATAEKIKGQRGSFVQLSIRRKNTETGVDEALEFSVKRAKVPLESVKEARLLDDGIGYARISDFKDNTASDLKKSLQEMLDQGMKAFILDLRWNPGGLLTASKEVSELFLPRRSLVTYTKGREMVEGKANPEDMELRTESRPILPMEYPIIILVNQDTASSSEIVTGALQYHQRAIVVGEKTYGKGSVQTIIPLRNPENTALRLTTALYYTPADVTIDEQGIFPDVEVPFSDDEEVALARQMYRSYADDPGKLNKQNHGTVSGDPLSEEVVEQTEEEKRVLAEVERLFGAEPRELLYRAIPKKVLHDRTIDDVQLKKAVEIIQSDAVWTRILEKYHRDVRETQLSAEAVAKLKKDADSSAASDGSHVDGAATEEVLHEAPAEPAAPVTN